MKTLANVKMAMLTLIVLITLGSAQMAGPGIPQTKVEFKKVDAGEGIYQLIYIAHSEQKKVEIKLYDAKGEKFFSDMIQSKKSFKKRYDLSSLPGQTYTVLITDDFKNTKSTFEISGKGYASQASKY